jgi:hypothetical protein
MKYETLKVLKDERFRRLTGVKRATFEKMVHILKEGEAKKKALGGKPNKLKMEDRLLMALEYIREYRTYFHVATSYGLSESACYRNIRWIEDTLIKHPDFALPGRKALLESGMDYEVVLIDARESPIERPKKSKSTSIRERRKGTH